jgi:hypothetical protein
MTALPTTANVVAAVDAVLIDLKELVAVPGRTYRWQGI